MLYNVSWNTRHLDTFQNTDWDVQRKNTQYINADTGHSLAIVKQSPFEKNTWASV